PRSASAEVVEEGDLIVISGEIFGDMIKANPEIAVRMLRKYSIRLRETNKQIEQILAKGGAGVATAPPKAQEIRPAPVPTNQTVQTEALAYFVSASTGNVFPAFKSENLIGRFDS